MADDNDINYNIRVYIEIITAAAVQIEMESWDFENIQNFRILKFCSSGGF